MATETNIVFRNGVEVSRETVEVPSVYRALTPNQVVDLLLAQIGVAGFAACVADAGAALTTWRFKLTIARDITRDQAARGTQIIVDAGHMTAEQRTALLAAWPTR